VTGTVLFNYNSDFKVSSEIVTAGPGLGARVSFTYDFDRLLTSAGYPFQANANITLTRNQNNGLLTATTLGNVSDSTSYNGFAEPIHYTAKYNAANIYDVQYTYDDLGRITQKMESINGSQTSYTFGYDIAGRLATVNLNNAPQPIVTYGYDSNDNRTSINTG